MMVGGMVDALVVMTVVLKAASMVDEMVASLVVVLVVWKDDS